MYYFGVDPRIRRLVNSAASCRINEHRHLRPAYSRKLSQLSLHSTVSTLEDILQQSEIRVDIQSAPPGQFESHETVDKLRRLFIYSEYIDLKDLNHSIEANRLWQLRKMNSSAPSRKTKGVRGTGFPIRQSQRLHAQPKPSPPAITTNGPKPKERISLDQLVGTQLVDSVKGQNGNGDTRSKPGFRPKYEVHSDPNDLVQHTKDGNKVIPAKDVINAGFPTRHHPHSIPNIGPRSIRKPPNGFPMTHSPRYSDPSPLTNAAATFRRFGAGTSQQPTMKYQTLSKKIVVDPASRGVSWDTKPRNLQTRTLGYAGRSRGKLGKHPCFYPDVPDAPKPSPLPTSPDFSIHALNPETLSYEKIIPGKTKVCGVCADKIRPCPIHGRTKQRAGSYSGSATKPSLVFPDDSQDVDSSISSMSSQDVELSPFIPETDETRKATPAPESKQERSTSPQVPTVTVRCVLTSPQPSAKRLSDKASLREVVSEREARKQEAHLLLKEVCEYTEKAHRISLTLPKPDVDVPTVD